MQLQRANLQVGGFGGWWVRRGSEVGAQVGSQGWFAGVRRLEFGGAAAAHRLVVSSKTNYSFQAIPTLQIIDFFQFL